MYLAQILSLSLVALQTANIFTGCILTNREAVAQLANSPIMLGRLIRLFRHLERQNPSIISDYIGRARIVQQLWRNQIEEKSDWNGTEE